MAQDPLAILPYYAGIVTLTNSAQTILALLKSIYTGNTVPPPNLCVAQLNLKADAGNGGNNCLIGDVNLSTTVYGDQLSSTAADRGVIIGPFGMNIIPLADMYAIASGGSPKLLIQVWTV